MKVDEFSKLEQKFEKLIEKTLEKNDSNELIKFLLTDVYKIGKKHFNYFNVYFEKALQKNPDDDKIWEAYFNLVREFNQEKFKMNILERASKCCYSISTFWILLLKEIESSEEVDNESTSYFIYFRI